MSKTTKTPPVPTRRPTKVAKPAKPAAAAKPKTAQKTPAKSQAVKDKVTTTAEAKKPEGSSGIVETIGSALSEWWSGDQAKTEAKTESKTDAKAKTETKPEAPAMSLNKGETLRRGAKGEKVTQLQKMLKADGADIEPDGKFGPKTKAALAAFQKKHELTPDGILGPDTLAAINGNKGTDGAKTGGEVKTDGAKPVDQAGKAEGAQGETGKTGKGRFANTRDSLNKLPGPLKKYADTFQAAGEKYGVDPRFLAAISMHETANGKSSAFRNKNNAMGISGKRGPLHQSSVESSIHKMAKGLAKPNGYYKGKTTIGQIGRVYAPKGAKNDPTGLNGYWPKGVASNFRKFGGNPTQQVIFR